MNKVVKYVFSACEMRLLKEIAFLHIVVQYGNKFNISKQLGGPGYCNGCLLLSDTSWHMVVMEFCPRPQVRVEFRTFSIFVTKYSIVGSNRCSRLRMCFVFNSI